MKPREWSQRRLRRLGVALLLISPGMQLYFFHLYSTLCITITLQTIYEMLVKQLTHQ